MLAECPVCTEKSIQLETKGIQPGGTLPQNLSCLLLSCVYRKLDSAENGPETADVLGSALAARRR